MSDNDKLGELENKIGYVFQNKKLLMLALHTVPMPMI